MSWSTPSYTVTMRMVPKGPSDTAMAVINTIEDFVSGWNGKVTDEKVSLTKVWSKIDGTKYDSAPHYTLRILFIGGSYDKHYPLMEFLYGLKSSGILPYLVIDVEQEVQKQDVTNLSDAKPVSISIPQHVVNCNDQPVYAGTSEQASLPDHLHHPPPQKDCFIVKQFLIPQGQYTNYRGLELMYRTSYCESKMTGVNFYVVILVDADIPYQVPDWAIAYECGTMTIRQVPGETFAHMIHRWHSGQPPAFENQIEPTTTKARRIRAR